MKTTQEIQLITLLMDIIPILDGDTIQGISPEAKEFTRQKLVNQLEKDKASFSESDSILLTLMRIFSFCRLFLMMNFKQFLRNKFC